MADDEGRECGDAQRLCPRCKGEGRLLVKGDLIPCPDCGGEGIVSP